MKALTLLLIPIGCIAIGVTFTRKPPPPAGNPDTVGSIARDLLQSDNGNVFTNGRKLNKLSVLYKRGSNNRADYNRVAVAVVECLKGIEPDSQTVNWMSAKHCAFLIAESWQVREAEARLLELSEIQLNPRLIPTGISLTGEAFCPAAEALVALRVSPDNLIRAIASDKDGAQPSLAWVLARTYGREDALRILERELENRNEGTEALASARTRIKSVEHIHELLPALFAANGTPEAGDGLGAEKRKPETVRPTIKLRAATTSSSRVAATR